MPRIYNFSAGPSVMPQAILEQARDEMLDWQGRGLSILEMPFTGDDFKSIAAEAEADLRDLLTIPDNYRVLFMHGGATAQLSLVPMNLLGGRKTAAYADLGYWSGRAIDEAKRYCDVTLAASGKSLGYTDIPPPEAWKSDLGNAAYCHITSNETADGLEINWRPETGNVPLVADMTSNFLTRPINVAEFGLIYAGAQKNIGPAGLCLVLIRDDLLGLAHPLTPKVFQYGIQAENDSRYNTPLTYGIYLAGLVFRWLKDQGGLAAMERENRAKSGLLYELIDNSNGFYRCKIAPASRSRVNVCFHLGDPALEPDFLSQARENGLFHLSGHKRIGGLRASLYNAMPLESVKVLSRFMDDFAQRRG